MEITVSYFTKLLAVADSAPYVNMKSTPDGRLTADTGGNGTEH